MSIKTKIFDRYLPHREDRLVMTTRNHIAPGGAYFPFRVKQIIGGKGWSLAIIRIAPLEPKAEEES